MNTRRSRASPSARQVRKSAPAHQTGIAMKEEKTKDERRRRGGDRGAVEALAAFPDRGGEDPGQEGARDRARQRAGGRRGDRERRPPGLQRAERRQAEGHAEGEGQLPVGEQRDDARREPERRPARLRPPVITDQAVEEVGGRDDRQHPHHLRADQRRRGREQHAVVERVVARVPGAVPDRQAGVLEQLGVENLSS
jgi:hypothetical protein